MRLTTSLSGLRESHQVRVNCLVPGWIASPHVKAFYDGLTSEQRRQAGAPDRLLTLDEIAGAVLRLITDDGLAGRVLVLNNCKPPRLIPFGDQGYANLK